MSKMPRKKRGGSRGSSPEKGMSGTLGDGQYGPDSTPAAGGLAWADVVGHTGQVPHTQEQEQTFQQIQEMFKNKIDADVIYMVLSESDWKVEEALEKLFVVSADNEMTSPQPLSMQSVAQALSMSALNPNQQHQQQQPPQQQPANHSPSAIPSSVSSPIPINMAANNSANVRLDLRSRLPSNPQREQPTTPEFLTMLSPKTPAGVSVDFPELFMGQQGSGGGGDSAVQSAMEALGAFANNPSVGLMPRYDSSKPGYQPNNSYSLGVGQTERTMSQEQPFNPDLSKLNGSGYHNQGQGVVFPIGGGGQFSQNSKSGSVNMNSHPYSGEQAGQSVNLFATQSLAQTGQNVLPPAGTEFSSGYPFKPDLVSLSQDSSEQTMPGPVMDSSSANNAQNSLLNQQLQGAPLPDLPHITYNAQGMPVRKGHRKKTLSLDPAEREALETLIEDVIIGGVDEGVIDSDESSDSESGDKEIELKEPQTPKSPECSDTLSPEEQKKFLAGDGGQQLHDKKDGKDGEGGQREKRGKQEKGKDGGKVYPAQLKVAVKHMKSLPPRFLRRLQTAQKQLEANAKKAEGQGDQPGEKNQGQPGDPRAAWNNSAINIAPPSVSSPDGKDREAKDKSKAKEDHLKEKKKKIRNLLDDLDQYTDETTVVIEEKDKDGGGEEAGERTENDRSPGLNLSPQTPTVGGTEVLQQLQSMPLAGGPQQPKSPILLKPGQQVVNCADLERELLQPPANDGHISPGDLTMGEPSHKMSPMAQRMANLAAASSQQNVLSLAAMAQDSLSTDYHNVPQSHLATEKHTQFSVDAPEFVPKGFGGAPGYDQLPQGQLGQYPDMSGQSGVSLQSMGQPLPQGVTPEQLRALQHSAFLQKPSSPFQAPMGRMSPQVAPAAANTVGRLSPQVVAVSSAAGPPAPPQQVSPEQITSMPGRNSPGPGFMIPKVSSSMQGPVPLPPPGAGIGMVPYSGYSIPPPGPFPPRMPGGYPQQFPFRPPPFVPPQQGYGPWSTGDKLDRFTHPHGGPKGHHNRPPGHKDKRGGHQGSPRMPSKGRGGHNQGGPHAGQQAMAPEGAKVRVESLLKEGHKVMVILRGLPGSGKSTLAKEVQFDGVTLTTDDFFVGNNGLYNYDNARIGEAHQWNQRRAKEACDQGKNPIVVDNTNTQSWEMKYYVSLAQEHNYRVEIIEPNTPWKFKARELAKRNTHGVSLEAITKMLDRYEKNLTPESILATSDKIKETVERQQARKVEEQQSLPVTPQTTDNQSETKKRKRKRKRKKDKKKTTEPTTKDPTDDDKDENSQRQEEKPDSILESDDEDEGSVVEADMAALVESSPSEDESSPGKELLTGDEPKEAADRQNSSQSGTSSEDRELQPCEPEEKNVNQDERVSSIGSNISEAKTEEAATDKLKCTADISTPDQIPINDQPGSEGELEEMKCRPDTEPPMGNSKPCTSMRGTDKEEENHVDAASQNTGADDQSHRAKISLEASGEQGILSQSAPAFGSREWRKAQRSPDVPRKISVTLADLKEALLQELAECEMGADSSDAEDTGSMDAKDLEKVIEVIKDIQEDVQAQNIVPVSSEPAEVETSYWSQKLESADPYVIESGASVMKASGKDTSPSDSKITVGSLPKISEVMEPMTALPKREKKRSEKKRQEKSPTKTSDIAPDETDPWGQIAASEWGADSLAQPSDEGTETTTEIFALEMPNTPPSPKKRRSPSKMQRAKQEEPVLSLESDVKQELLSQGWSLPTPYLDHCPQTSFFQISVTAGNLSNFKHAETCTTVDDKVTMQRLQHGHAMQNVKVMMGRPREIAEGYQVLAASPSKYGKIKVDQSTSTEDRESEAAVDGLSFLASCFPTVTKDDLHDILQNCSGNVEWAVNIMLDAGYEYNDPTAQAATSVCPEPQAPVETSTPVTSRSRKAKTNVTTHGATADASAEGLKSPTSLLELCHTTLSPQQDLGSRDVLEKFTKTNLKRLKSIEEYKRQRGASECSEEPHDISSAQRTLSLSLSEDFDSPDKCGVVEEPLMTSEAGQQSEAPVEGEERQAEKAEEGARISPKDDLTLTLSPELATQLIQMFGPVGFHISPDSLSGDDLHVCLNRKTAQHIHRRWALTLQQKFSMEEAAICSMMREDEELARRLQAEEDLAQYTRLPSKAPSATMSRASSLVPSPQASPGRRPAGLVGIQPGTVALEVVHRQPSPPASLRYIMQEEQAIQASKQEFLESQAEASGQEHTISTQLKRQKLQGMFPGLDTGLLEEVYQAHGYSFEDTVNTLRGSHGPSRPVQSHFSSCSTNEDTELNRAIQQSLASQWLGSAEDSSEQDTYQSYEDPEYQDFRAEASMHYRLRHECFQKAQAAYRQGMKTVASFYSQQGHLHTEKLRQANRRAAEAILEHRNPRLQQNEVDLHGLHVDEALEVLQAILAAKSSELRERPDRRRQHLSVITGRGSHSRGGVARIKPSVIDFLRRNDYTFTEPQPGLLKVTLRS